MKHFWFIASHKRLKRREHCALQPFGEGMRGSVAIGSLVLQETVTGALPSGSGTASDMHRWTIWSSYSVTSCLSSGSSDSSRLSLERMGSDQVTGAECFQLEPNQAALDAGAVRQGFPHRKPLVPHEAHRRLQAPCTSGSFPAPFMASLNFSPARNPLKDMGVCPSDSSSFLVLVYCCVS